jgi:hypothetical protein
MRQLGGPNVEKLTAKCDVKGLAKSPADRAATPEPV